jgi:hypothetical protein
VDRNLIFLFFLLWFCFFIWLNSHQVLVKNYATKINLTGPSINDVTDKSMCNSLGSGRLNFSDTRSLSKPPQSHLQKGSKTSCDEIFFLNRDIIFGQLNLEGVKIHYGEVQKIWSVIWCEPLEQICGSFSWEKWRDVIYEDLPSETKKMFWNFSCSLHSAKSKTQKKIRFQFFLILSSFRIQIEDENSHSVFWREICKWFLSSEFLAFYSSINLII